MLEALEYMHGKNQYHKDLKPENILLTDTFNIKVADFRSAGPTANRNGNFYHFGYRGALPY